MIFTEFINSDETKAYCSIETVLLDALSGIVQFTVSQARSLHVKMTNDLVLIFYSKTHQKIIMLLP